MRRCKDCGDELVTQGIWLRMTSEERQVAIAAGQNRLLRNDWCVRCGEAVRRGRRPGPRRGPYPKVCVECSASILPWTVWRDMTPDERAEARAEGKSRGRGKGRCSRCAEAHDRGTAIADIKRLTPVEMVVEEWNMLADRDRTQAANIRLIAPRMGMTEGALAKALQRARRRGLELAA